MSMHQPSFQIIGLSRITTVHRGQIWVLGDSNITDEGMGGVASDWTA